MSVATDDRDARIAALEEENARLRSALSRATEWFQGYADWDGITGDVDKAKRSQESADVCRAALEAKP